MNLTEAIEHLKNGKKIRLHGWGKDCYLIKKKDDNRKDIIKFYQLQSRPYPIELIELISDDWIELNSNDNKKYSFAEIIKNMWQENRKYTKSLWDDKYLEMDRFSKTIILKVYEEVPTFMINFEGLMMDQWEIE